LILQSLTVPLVALVLAVRGVVSRDVRWKRLVAACLAVLPLIVMPIILILMEGGNLRGSPEPWSGAVGILGRNLPALFLIIWSFLSRDPLWVRIGSAAVGAFAFLPLLSLLIAVLGFASR
jgi:hypothetical protein